MNWSSSDTAGDGTVSVAAPSATGHEGDAVSSVGLDGAWALVDAIIDALVVACVERRVVIA